MYALVDCNSFYASCERLFRADLRTQPVIVLSNNDGCVVARSAEAKALGIGMAVPFFQVKNLCKQHKVAVFSSNYTLYQDISNRVMCTLETLVPKVSIYSIDEAFLHLDGLIAFQQAPMQFAARIRHTVYQYVGIPVGVGVGASKTLAKLANHYAKKEQGVCILTEKTYIDYYLKKTPVNEVWGVGKGLTQRLAHLGIHTAYELAHAEKYWLRKHTSVMLERTARELLGEDCCELTDVSTQKQKKQIVCSRSFGTKITDKAMLQEALCHYTARATEKLREQNAVCKHVSIFFRTSMFGQHTQKRRLGGSVALIHPTQDTRVLTKQAMQLLDAFWQPGYPYAKAGVMLSDIANKNTLQYDLLTPFDEQADQASQALMKTVDTINGRYGSHTLNFGGQGIKDTRKRWRMSANNTSPRYTTNINELPLVY